MSDNDIWFQSKALNAYKEYSTHKEHLHDLIQTKNESCQRVAADLLQRIPDESAAEILIKSQDSQTKKCCKIFSKGCEMAANLSGR